MSDGLEIAMVGRRPEFVPWVTNSWIRSGLDGGLHRDMDPKVWTAYEHALIARYWRLEHATWLFATNPQDTNFGYGWVCGEHTDLGPILHYLYVRRRMRDSAALQFGVAEALLRTFAGGPQERITLTRRTPKWERKLRLDARVRGLAAEWFYNPYLAFDQFAPWRTP